ncbi:hypothetical protein V9T40_008273 [Parthenolecanium corni]|uniref:Uncharacterized protein n=1 Tax=Parthenolecanium corni TaxID=536013 RepID=A0AAN9TLD2_9HEMI
MLDADADADSRSPWVGRVASRRRRRSDRADSTGSSPTGYASFAHSGLSGFSVSYTIIVRVQQLPDVADLQRTPDAYAKRI